MSRQLVILGTTVTLPDPGSVTDLAARFQGESGQLADSESTLQTLTRPDAWGGWTGLAADAFGQSIGQLPAELGDVRDAYAAVASALRQYAGQLESVVSAISALSYQAEDAEYTLAAVERARSQAIASGHNPATTGWNARLADANAAVSTLRGRLSRLVAELNALAATCTRQITAAEPTKAHKGLFGELESDFLNDVADPVGRAAKELGKLEFEAGRVELTAAAAVVQALFIDPVTHGVRDVSLVAGHFKHLDAEQWGQVLGDVAGVLGIVALLPIPGVDVIAGVAALAFAGAAAAADWVAVAKHEKGASYMQASLATVGFALVGVGAVAKAGVTAERAAPLLAKGVDAADGLADGSDATDGLADGSDAANSAKKLWETGLQRTFTLHGIDQGLHETKAVEDAPTGLGDFGQKLLGNVKDSLIGSPPPPGVSPAAVQVTRVGWTANRLGEGVNAAQDFGDDWKAESKVL